MQKELLDLAAKRNWVVPEWKQEAFMEKYSYKSKPKDIPNFFLLIPQQVLILSKVTINNDSWVKKNIQVFFLGLYRQVKEQER